MYTVSGFQNHHSWFFSENQIESEEDQDYGFPGEIIKSFPCIAKSAKEVICNVITQPGIAHFGGSVMNF